MILVDTNVLIDLLGRREPWLEWSRQEMTRARVAGAVGVNEVAFAELCAGFPSHEEAERFIGAAGVDLLATPRPALFAAGRAHRAYRRRSDREGGVLPDFIIGAHAQALGCALLTRDVRRYRTHFPDVRLITP